MTSSSLLARHDVGALADKTDLTGAVLVAFVKSAWPNAWMPPAAKLPEASLATTAKGLLNEVALIADRGMPNRPKPPPVKLVAVMFPAAKFPEASLATTAKGL